MSNVDKEMINEIINEFPYEPLFNKVVITLNKEEAVGLDISESQLDEKQYVVAGTFTYGNVTIKPGDEVLLDLKSLQRPIKTNSADAYETVYQIEINPIFANGRMFAIINDRNINAKIK